MSSVKTGVFIPTCNRPDMLRACVAQWCLQSRIPDVICVHQNGSDESYRWSIEDYLPRANIIWLHTPEKIPQHHWYIKPLQRLIEEGCTHFFWSDDDDLYHSNHIETCLSELIFHEFRVSEYCRVLFTQGSQYEYQPISHFDVHGPGGMSSSMAFNKRFAEELLKDLTEDTSHYYSDNVLALVTLPKFSAYKSQHVTTTYKCHPGTQSSSHWLKEKFKQV